MAEYISGMGETNKELINSCKVAELVEGKRFGKNAKAAELKAWAANRPFYTAPRECAQYSTGLIPFQVVWNIRKQ